MNKFEIPPSVLSHAHAWLGSMVFLLATLSKMSVASRSLQVVDLV